MRYLTQSMKNLKNWKRQKNKLFSWGAWNHIGRRGPHSHGCKNILSNALKYTRKCNTAVISVSMEYDKPFKRISVTDNGAGFDEEYSDKLFNVFQRLHSSSEFEGSGVGLAIVKK